MAKVTSSRRVAFFLSVDSFEGFYGGIFGLDRETFLTTYRNDFVWEYAKGLIDHGHSVVLYILSYGRPELRTISAGLAVRFLPLPRWLRLADPVTYRLRKIPGFRTLRDRVAFAGYGRAFQAALTRDEIDVIYHQEIWTPRFDLVARGVSLPLIGAEHGAVYASWMEADKRSSLKLAASLTCQSREAVERVQSLGGKPELLYNGVDTDFFMPMPGGAKRANTILTVGRLVEQQKRFADLLRAMLFLPEFKLLIVGSGPDEPQLRRLCLELGLKERVTFSGFVKDRSELRRLYRECSVFVSSSAWEAVALVVLEAMSCEMPVVCTQIPSFEELIENGVDGLLIPMSAPEKMAAAIRIAVAQAQPLGTKARKTVIRRYSSTSLYARLSMLVETAYRVRTSTDVSEARPGPPDTV